MDPAKVARARGLLGARATSEVIDIALDRLIRAERLRADVAAYRRSPPAQVGDRAGVGDDTDWEALYPEGST